MADHGTIDLMGGGFTRGMLAELEQKMLQQVFSKHIERVEARINDGKEATVYLCSGKGNQQPLAAKVYRDRRFRGFANNADYTDVGRVRDKRLAKAIRKGSRVGRRVSQRMWVEREWQALQILFDSGASVPRPIDHAPDAVLMEYVGDNNAAAPMLAQVRLDAEQARAVHASVMRDVEVLLDCGLVHGDLSAYNILFFQGRPRLIDLPQVVEVDEAVDAWALFYRDVENLSSYFQRQGLSLDPMNDALRLWSRYVG